VCRQSVDRCRVCQAWNRSQARVCRECGAVLQHQQPNQGQHQQQDQRQPIHAASDGSPALDRAAELDPTILERSPARSETDQPVPTAPVAAGGFLWAMGAEGSLYRINPFGLPGRQIEVQTRLWAGTETHAFAVRDLKLPEGSLAGESFAVVATSSGIQACGLVSQRLHRSEALLEGEQILCDARDAYQLVEASGSHAFCLVRQAGETSVLRVHLPTGQSTRVLLQAKGEPVCGPVLVDAGALVMWSPTTIWTLSDEVLERQTAPAGVSLWTAPSEDGRLRLPLGRSPAIVSAGRFVLPCHQYGEPALLQFQSVGSRKIASVIPVTGDGVLSVDAADNPLLASRGRLSVCVGGAFRDLAADDQLSGGFAAFHDRDLSLFFCDDSYGGRSLQWLKARNAGIDQRVEWGLARDQRLKECGGFWSIGGSITSQMLLEDQFARTEFVTWHG